MFILVYKIVNMYVHVCTMFRHVCTDLPIHVHVVRIPDGYLVRTFYPKYVPSTVTYFSNKYVLGTY